MTSVQDFLIRDDPLTREVAGFLVNYAEEDDRVDYKETIDTSSQKHWLELTKDISALANTYGGFLVYGVTDGEKRPVGVSRAVAEALKDVNNLQQKVNRFLEPHVTGCRAKEFRFDNVSLVIIYVPRSVGVTHMISRDGAFTQPSGKQKILLYKGTFFVRRSASNHLADSRDLDEVIERRIDQFRDALLDKVATVVRSPANSDVFILSRDPDDKEAKRFVIEDAPDSIAVKGMSFTVAPEGFEQEVTAWTVMSRGSSEVLPPAVVVWKWYAHREEIEVTERQRLAIFQFSLWVQAPAFYWVKGLKASQIRDALLEAVRNRPNNIGVDEMLAVASFLGKGVYTTVISLLADYRERLNPSMRKFPSSGARKAFGTIPTNKSAKESDFRKQQLQSIDSIAVAVEKSGKQPGLEKRWKALKIDRFLYAQDNQYK